ncbi:hypothetical protein CC78DRAFT_602242, partial [Lojkania enalia]
MQNLFIFSLQPFFGVLPSFHMICDYFHSDLLAKMFSRAFLVSSLTTLASAHQNFHELFVNGVNTRYQIGIRVSSSNSPVISETDVTSKDIACNLNRDVTVPTNECNTIKVQWDQSGRPVSIMHFIYGPVDDAGMVTGIGSWVKIDKLDYVDGKWANGIMRAQNTTNEFKFPNGLASGEYMLRSKMLALHAAQTFAELLLDPVIFYIRFAQPKITGMGSRSCSPSIGLPRAYTAEGPNIYIPNIIMALTRKLIPHPVALSLHAVVQDLRPR